MQDIHIDVIIPCYNAHKTLDRALASIAMQDISHSVLVTLVDDCSPNGGYHAFIDKWSGMLNIQEFTLKKNGGPAVARQAGMDETDGDFIVFVDADDTLATSFALRQMLQEMIKGNMDVVGGQFVEETEGGTFFVHTSDMVWVFAKMYRRSFLERFLIRFNKTRANEDTGFNAVVSNLTTKISHIPQTVYMWHWAENTITRSNKGEYTWASGHRGYIDNMIWAVGELKKRNVNKEVIRSLATTIMCRLYFMHEDVMASAEWETEESMKAIKKFYAECFKPLEDQHAMPLAYLYTTFGDEQEAALKNSRTAHIVFRQTFRDFMKTVKED
jgi:glycosyltransferase involved in cell wall biosynthesis